MRVSLVIDWHPASVGGVQSYVRDLYNLLKRRGMEVSIISRRIGEGELSIDLREGHYIIDSLLPIDALLVPPDLESIEEALRKTKPDIVHSHHIFTLTPLFALKGAWKLGIPSVATNHTIFLAYDSKALWGTISLFLPTRYYLPYARAVISVSKAADKFVESVLGSEYKGKRYVVPGGVDVERYRPPEEEPEENYILFVGRLVYRKGLHVAIKALQYVRKDIKLYVVGKGYMEFPSYLLAKAYGVDDRVRFLGVVSESKKAELYRGATAVVVPSIINESMGIVALEAMASGRPVVATTVGGLGELIEHGETGILVKPGDERAIADAINMLLDDASLRRRLGANARKAAEEKYSWNVVFETTLKIFEEVMGG